MLINLKRYRPRLSLADEPDDAMIQNAPGTTAEVLYPYLIIHDDVTECISTAVTIIKIAHTPTFGLNSCAQFQHMQLSKF